jgi:hypothetical protein
MSRAAAEAHQLIVSASPWATGNGAVARFVVCAFASLCMLPPMRIDSRCFPGEDESYAAAHAFSMQHADTGFLALYILRQIRETIQSPATDYCTFIPSLVRDLEGIVKTKSCHPLDYLDGLHDIWQHAERSFTGPRLSQPSYAWGVGSFDFILSKINTRV